MPGKNGGTLNRGGTYPGGGRPSNELRASLRGILDKGLPHLEDIATGKAGKPSAAVSAPKVAGQYGLEDPFEEDFLKELAAAVGQVLKQREDGDELLEQIFDKWRPVIAKRL